VTHRHRRPAGPWKRRSLLATAALGGLGLALGGGELVAPDTAEATEMTVPPVFGAGLFDVDPPQDSISQDPNVAVTGDIAVFPEDWGY